MSLNVVMLGPPGVGKGTQAERLAQTYGIPRISTGDILREAVQADTDLGRLAKATVDAGGLVSDEIMIAIVGDRLARPDAQRGFVLDGFPRTIPQATALDAAMARRGELTIINLVAPEQELTRRLQARRICSKCGMTASAYDGKAQERCERCGGKLVSRSDDDAAAVRERLRVYDRDTKPLVEYYRQRSGFHAVDGAQPPDRVAAAVQTALGLNTRSGSASASSGYAESAS